MLVLLRSVLKSVCPKAQQKSRKLRLLTDRAAPFYRSGSSFFSVGLVDLNVVVALQTGAGRNRLPMMTFSFRPSSGSTLPLMAASVSTRVVSWKDAAERKDSVASAALVMPSRVRLAVAGRPPTSRPSVGLIEAEDVHQRAGQQVGVVGLLDLDLAQHLTHDDLDVLVGDFDTLTAVDRLDFLDEVVLYGLTPRMRSRSWG